MSWISALAIISIASGSLCERFLPLAKATKQRLSKMLIYVIYPSLIFASLVQHFDSRALGALWAMPTLLAGLLALGFLLGKIGVPWLFPGTRDSPRARSFRFIAIMPNYSFLPLVIAQAMFGERGFGYVVLASLGADIFLWIFAVQVLKVAKGIAWKPLLSPPLLSLIAALICILWIKDRQPEPLKHLILPLSWIGKLTIPCSMFLLGTYLSRKEQAPVTTAAHGVLFLWRLILSPLAMVLALFLWPQPIGDEASATLLLIASMPAAIISVVLSELHDGDTHFTSQQIFYGHLFWIVTGPVLGWIFGYFFTS